jgi:hypothetical protein
MAKKMEANNSETGTANSFRKDENSQLPAEAGREGSADQLKDKGDLGKKSHMEQTSLKEEEGYETMDDDESTEGSGDRLPGDEPGA